MRVGLDFLPLGPLFQLDSLGLMDVAVEYGYEGVQISGHDLLKDPAHRQQVIEKSRETGLYVELGGGGIDTALSGRSVQELVERWEPLFAVATEVGSPTLNTGLSTWPWEGRVIQESGKTMRDQIAGGIATLRALRGMAEDHGVAVVIHTSFNTAREYTQIMEAVDSPFVGLCLDTANAFLVFEDPVEFARQVAPWVKSTHLKDSVIYLHGAGIDWMGGSPLGRGLVDLPAIVDVLYQANPATNLSIEDHYGRMTMPVFDAGFLSSFPEWNGSQVAGLLTYLQKGHDLLAGGLVPTAEEAKRIDWKTVFPERARHNAAYAKQLRDQAVARYQTEEPA
jgi:sugar phosphate isomerase/epimerase